MARNKRLRRNQARGGAQERTRPSTPLRAPAPEAGASTNSATWAQGQTFGRGRRLRGASGGCQCLIRRCGGLDRLIFQQVSRLALEMSANRLERCEANALNLARFEQG